MGEDGLLVYRTFNNTVANHFTDIHAVSVLVWDNKAFALTTDGELRVRSLQAPDFDPASPEPTLPPDAAPRGLEVFWDRAGDPAVFVVTERRYGPTTRRTRSCTGRRWRRRSTTPTATGSPHGGMTPSTSPPDSGWTATPATGCAPRSGWTATTGCLPNCCARSGRARRTGT